MKRNISTFSLFFLAVLVFVFTITGCEYSNFIFSESATQTKRLIQGELVRIERNSYTVKDQTGSEISFLVTSDTLVDKSVRVGDPITISLGHEGEPIALRKDR